MIAFDLFCRVPQRLLSRFDYVLRSMLRVSHKNHKMPKENLMHELQQLSISLISIKCPNPFNLTQHFMSFSFVLNPRLFTSFLLKCVLFLLLAGLISVYLIHIEKFQLFGLLPLFDLNGEFTIPSFFSTLLLWLSGTFLWLNYLL